MEKINQSNIIKTIQPIIINTFDTVGKFKPEETIVKEIIGFNASDLKLEKESKNGK